jgi:indoleamine 2,3-dioxygenase
MTPSNEIIRVPATISVPLVAVSKFLGIAPILTFADTVLWNWDLVDADKPLSMDNMRIQNLFSGRESEAAFYHASAKVEFCGVEMLQVIEKYNALATSDFLYIQKIARYLNRLESLINEMTEVMQSIRVACDPHIFYWDVRPWYEGADAKGPASPGWTYEGVPNSHLLDLSGPSAGQSSVIHALDIFLDIDHKLNHRRHPAPSVENKKADLGFMERMRRYMPGKHRAYLAQLQASPRPIRMISRSNSGLREHYDATVTSLKKLRDSHIRIVCLYVINTARALPSARSGCPASAMMKRLAENRAVGDGPVRGTGGTNLALLLKAGRDATHRAVLNEQSIRRS